MAEQQNAQGERLMSAPIIPDLPQIERSNDVFFKATAPIVPVVSPVIPSGTIDNISINQQVQGDYKTGPNPGAKKSEIDKSGGTMDYIKAVANQMHDESSTKDRFKYARTYSYGAGYKNMNFERYYKHPKFAQLGFSPYRDNEAHYNENSSWWDDFNRMRGEWGGLAWSGAKSVWGSEEEANEIMDKGMAIGQSSRGGAGGWITNFGLNTAYTTGIMAEMAVENLALAAIEVGSFGSASAPVGAAVVSRNILLGSRLVKGLNYTYNAIKSLKKAETAGKFFSAAKAGDKAVDLAKWLNPFQEGIDFTTHLAKGTGGVKNMSDAAIAAKTFGSFYRGVRELNLAHSEASLEGEGAARRYQEQLLDDYYAEHGQVAEGKEAEDIFNRAQSLKASVTLANDMTIYLTNKLVFDDLFKGIRPGAAIADAFLKGSGRTLEKVEAGAYKLGDDIAKAGTKTGLKKTRDFLIKSEYVPWSRQYFVGNLGEGLQESLQESISGGLTEYYDRIKKDPFQVGFYNQIAAIGRGVGDQFNAQGLDTFLSGYLMGSVIQGAQKGGMRIADETWSKVAGKKSKAALKKEQAEKTDNDILNAANYVGKNSLIFGDANINYATAMKQASDLANKKRNEGDELGAENADAEARINHMHVLVKSGNTGLITEHVKDMLTLDDKALAEAYDMGESAAPEIRKKLQHLSDRVEGYKRKYERAQRVFPNPNDPWSFAAKNKDGSFKYPEAFASEMDKYNAHEEAVELLLFATESYSDMAERMAKIGDNLTGKTDLFQNLVNVIKGGHPVANAAASDINLLIDTERRTESLKGLREQVSLLTQGTPEQKKEGAKLQTQIDALVEWNNAMDNYRQEYLAEKSSMLSPEKEQAYRQRARVRKGAEVKDKKGNSYKVQAVKGDYATVVDGKGKTKRMKRSSLEVTKDAVGKRLEYEALEGDALSLATSEMYDAFEKYLRNIAKIKDGYVFDEQMQEAFSEIRKYTALSMDSQGMVKTINVLSNPQYMDELTNIIAKNNALRSEHAERLMKEAIKSFRDQGLENDFLKDLFDIGVFVLPEDVDKLEDFSMVDFYNITGHAKLDPREELYKKALDIVEEYAAAAGKMVSDKPIPEAGQDIRAGVRALYNSKARDKSDTDKRTYADYAKQFGFDPASSSSEVAIADVLRAIIESEHATGTEKALARRFLTTVDSNIKITFVNNLTTPGSYNSKKKEINIDARYSSEDYIGGDKGHPIEFVILHEYGHALTVESLETDAEFKASITALAEKARAYQETKEYKDKFGSKPLYGTMNEAEFVTEALSNPTFQAMLASIPYDDVSGKPSTAWDEFVNSLRDLLSKVFGLTSDSTLLDEALYLITTKIDNPVVAAPTTGTTTPAGTPITIGSNDIVGRQHPIELIQRLLKDTLFADLMKAYQTYSDEILGKKLTDEYIANNAHIIIKSSGWKRFMETNRPEEVFAVFNKGRTGEAKPQEPVQKPTTKKPIIKSDAEKRWDIGNKWTLSGKSLKNDNSGDYITHTKVPVEVVERRLDVGNGINEIKFRNIATGEEFLIDLTDQESSLTVEPYTGTQVTEPTVSSYAEGDVIKTDTALITVISVHKDDKYLITFGVIGDDGKIATTQTTTQTKEQLDKYSAKAAELAALEEKDTLPIPTEYNGVKVVNVPGLLDSKGKRPAGAKHVLGKGRTPSEIHIDRELLRKKFAEKAWTKPLTAGVKPLDENLFMTYEEFETFVLEHEYQHTRVDHSQFNLSEGRKTSVGEYENDTNRRALEALGLLVTPGEEHLDPNTYKTLIEDFEAVDSKEKLEAWKDRALSTRGGSHVGRDFISAQIGETFNGDYIEKIIAQKEKDLALNLTFEDLQPGLIVVMQNGQNKVVIKNDGKNVTLSSYEETVTGNAPEGATSSYPKSEFKKYIKMKYGEFIDKAEVKIERSEEEIADSNKAIEEAGEVAGAKSKDITNEIKNKTDEELDEDDDLSKINSCSRPS